MVDNIAWVVVKMRTDKIIGYTDYYCDEYEYSKLGPEKENLIVDKQPNEIQRFFATETSCPFCGTELKKVFEGYYSCPRGADLFERGYVYECPRCSWWTCTLRFSEEHDLIDGVHSINTETKYYAVAKKYNISDKSLPIEILTKELIKRPKILYGINSYKMEELAQEILRGVYDCEVHHVGKKGDGGIDLLVLESDDPILVQVKRRENPEHVELVKGVREFVGTLFIENKRKGIYISTAKEFSRGSREVANRLLSNRQLDYFELIDYDKLCSLMGDLKKEKYWRRVVDYFYKKSDASIYDNEEAIKQREQRVLKFGKSYEIR